MDKENTKKLAYARQCVCVCVYIYIYVKLQLTLCSGIPWEENEEENKSEL